MAPASVACPQRLLRAIADAATQTWPAHGAALLRGRESDRLDLRILPRPDGAKHHPEAGWAPIDLQLLEQRTRISRIITVFLIE